MKKIKKIHQMFFLDYQTHFLLAKKLETDGNWTKISKISYCRTQLHPITSADMLPY